MGEELVFRRGGSPNEARVMVAEQFEGWLIGFGHVDGGAVDGAFETYKDGRRRWLG